MTEPNNERQHLTDHTLYAPRSRRLRVDLAASRIPRDLRPEFRDNLYLRG